VSCFLAGEDNCSLFNVVDGGEMRARSCSRSAALRLAAERSDKFSFRVSCSLRRSCCIDSGVGLVEFGVGNERFCHVVVSTRSHVLQRWVMLLSIKHSPRSVQV
jgi:hypothetical protein